MRIFPVMLALLACAAAAGEPPARPSARLLKAQPQSFQPDRCVIYREDGGGNGTSETDYFIKGRIVAAGVKALTRFDMPVFAKRRFQHGAAERSLSAVLFPAQESAYRRAFQEIYEHAAAV